MLCFCHIRTWNEKYIWIYSFRFSRYLFSICEREPFSFPNVLYHLLYKMSRFSLFLTFFADIIRKYRKNKENITKMLMLNVLIIFSADERNLKLLLSFDIPTHFDMRFFHHSKMPRTNVTHSHRVFPKATNDFFYNLAH